MTLQIRALQWSVIIHGLLLLGLFLVSRQFSAYDRTVLIDFSIISGQGNSAAPAPGVRTGVESKEPRSIPRPKALNRATRAVVQRGVSEIPAVPVTTVPITTVKSCPAPDSVPVHPSRSELETIQPEYLGDAGVLDQDMVNPLGMGASNGSEMDSSLVEGYGGYGTGGQNGAGQYLREHFDYISDMIMSRLNYPAIARKKGWSGKLKVSFLVLEDGSIDDVRVLTGTGYSILDKNAVDTVKTIAVLPSPPKRAEIVMPITYRIEERPN